MSTSTITTQALLDSGSDRSFCTRQLARETGSEGRRVQLSLATLAPKTHQEDTMEVDLQITGMGTRHNQVVFMPNVVVVSRLPTTLKERSATSEDLEPWEHLRQLTAPSQREPQNDEVGLLIGQDVPQALTPLEVRRGRDGEPFAVRTLLGWTINGPVRRVAPMNSAINCASALDLTTKESHPFTAETRLDHQVRKFWELEEGTGGRQEYLTLSVDDRKVLQLWTKTGQKIDGHYQFPIPFRKDYPDLPNNKVLAERRLQGLRKRLTKDPWLRRRYGEEMQLLLDKGHAEAVPRREDKDNLGWTWYLPHHPVLNPNKPNKVRIVFDCAASYNAISLNSQVLQGPDLNNKLLGILMRFRQGHIALMADVEAMFHQISVTPEHRDALRFLWWRNADLSRAPKEYRMTVHLFGGVWSPSCAAYALQRTFRDHGMQFSEAVTRTESNFYVDDLLHSTDSCDEAVEVANGLCRLLSLGGFRLTKWLSNHKGVLSSIPAKERHNGTEEVDLMQGMLPTERALGITWDLEKDQLAIRVQQRHKPATKRGLLSTMSSVYDPLGMVSPFTIKAKFLFQEECRRKRGWDEPLQKHTELAWSKWCRDLQQLDNVRVSRCYLPTRRADGVAWHLHHFCDASQRAYGMVTFLRAEDKTGNITCSFVYGKAKLAPLKQLTIPRLELCAATLAAKADGVLREELSMNVADSTFWTDSMVVLQYIANNERRFHTFVANRLTIIHECSAARQWRYVPSKQNPADDATRGLSIEDMNESSRWLKGPAFLWENEEQWPTSPYMAPIPEDDTEVRKVVAAFSNNSTLLHPHPLSSLCSRYSSWYRLLKAVAWLRRYIEWLRCSKQKRELRERLTPEDLRLAEVAVIRWAQEEEYAVEVASIQRDGSVSTQSKIYRLEPRLDEENILRLGGRLKHAPYPLNQSPVLVPQTHKIAELITQETHELSAGHSGREHTLGCLRRKYWIPKCRRLLDKVIRACVVCRRHNWRPVHQRQADLPTDRVTPGKPAFTYTGVDCFGPFTVKYGRKQIKRWGCLFTCLLTRAIHLEVLASLDADAFLNALSRFSARRGTPERIRSDRGTNMVRADKDLRQAALSWERDNHVQNTLLRKRIEWIFNPPTASHMGGVWERQIRTVRKVLGAIVGCQQVDDERLHTLFCEVEEIVNRRPITPVSTTAKDLEALTPMHLLRGDGETSDPHGGLLTEDAYHRRWKHAQFMADQFWKRWTKEYLPALRQRQMQIRPQRNFQPDDIVLVTSEMTHRGRWPLARVVEIHRSADDLVRHVKVKTAHGTLMRPVTKLCLLEGVLDRHHD